MLNSLFGTIDIASSGLSVQRTRMNTIAENIANAETTRTANGGPYRRQIPVVEAGTPENRFARVLENTEMAMRQTDSMHMPQGETTHIERCCAAGVHVAGIEQDSSPFKMVYDPYHPDANDEGYVAMPNVNPVQEMADLISTSRSFEANVTVIDSAKEMIRKALKL